ncbi:DUF1707 and DUF4870 domain-containing protein [Kribbella sandramycini]|uniref:DUF1707 and DUF4870 domain-containing protein n=1 Tax=Kribbella sandramycini TaxID=60450 RepID=A0A7Y4KWT2_9ACTN|nr:DUF1707 and DUF4870 domain-containing protein [Kribbella sandramycini]MBB6567343.1 putative Tic20 family protein [Kribbella sandramycini]NOL40044.1 DUF1707 and DUF4870 domain-containing protein [Kribbella sandramycini]
MSTSELLVTPEQRDRAVEILKEMYADGRIDHMEFDTRVDLALKARTRAELNGSFDGVVARPVPTYVPAAFTRPAPVQRYTGDGRGMGTVAHWLGYPTFFVGPAIVVASAGKQNPAVRRHAVEALNFQLTAFLAFAAAGIATGIVGSWLGFVFPILGIMWFILTGVGGIATAAGSNFRYPFTLRLIK